MSNYTDKFSYYYKVPFSISKIIYFVGAEYLHFALLKKIHVNIRYKSWSQTINWDNI